VAVPRDRRRARALPGGPGIAELFTIHYSDPASYAGDWGGPSLTGVLAVHSGPALVIIAATAWRLLRRRG
jgi:hypothetical protein